MNKIIFSLIAFIFFSYHANAQAPANDDCTGAVPLNVNTGLSCTLKTSGTLSEATRSNVESGISGYIPNNDVWYVFTATATNHKISLHNVQGSNIRPYIEVLVGNCGQLTSLTFSPDYSVPLTGLAIGTTFYVRIFTFRPSPTTFDICISTPPPITNDECATAIDLTVNPDLNCASVTSGHLIGATSSGSFEDVLPSEDVWYSFTATKPNHRISLQNYGVTEPPLGLQLFEGNCDQLNSKFVGIFFINNDSRDGINLVPGTTYYIRVFSGLRVPIATTFDICVGTFPVPSNDECPNAIALPVNADESCTLTTSGALGGATASNENSDISGIANDIWYSFTATATSHKIELLNATGPDQEAVRFEVLEGFCGQLRSISGSLSGSATIPSLTIGTTYSIRVFNNPQYEVRTSTFDICIGIPLPAPVNDDCINAITLAMNSDSSCTLKSAGTIANATNSWEGDNSLGTPDDDVWYSFVATSTSHTVSLLDIVGNPVLVYEIMQGSCGGQLHSLYSSNRSSNKISGLVVGETYYIRVFSSYEGVNVDTSFNICVAVPPPPPANDNCENAVSLAVNPNASCTQTASGTITGATNSQVGNGTNTPDDDVWYMFIATATSHKIKLMNVAGEQTDLVLEILNGSCGNQMISIGRSNLYEDIVSGLTIGNTYYVRVYSSTIDSVGSSSFVICVTTEQRPQNDNCANAIPLAVNTDLSCTIKATGTLINATDETNPNSQFAPRDVWYSFIATAPYHQIKINSSAFDCEVYQYAEDCQSNRFRVTTQTTLQGDKIPHGLTIGNTYLVRVLSYGSTTDTFELCIGTLPPAPINDNCSGAISLTIATSMEEGIINSTTVGATDFYYYPLPTCAVYSRGDVWFKTIIPPNGELHIQTGDPENSTNSPFDSGLAAYYGTCDGEIEMIACNDNISSTEVNSRISITNGYPGEELLIRVWEIGNDDQKPFTISAWSTSLTTPEFKTDKFKTYPNPVQNIVNLAYDQIITDVRIYNALGQAIVSKEINDKNGSIDLSQLPAGPYLVQITSNGITKNTTIIKQ